MGTIVWGMGSEMQGEDYGAKVETPRWGADKPLAMTSSNSTGPFHAVGGSSGMSSLQDNSFCRWPSPAPCQSGPVEPVVPASSNRLEHVSHTTGPASFRVPVPPAVTSGVQGLSQISQMPTFSWTPPATSQHQMP
eukprot:6039949-Amphidinium_carterae.1